MRGFIEFCGGLFVVLGMFGFVVSLLILITASAHNDGGMGVAAALGILIGSASVTLVGGTAYMLCEIDAKLEKAAPPDSGSTSGVFADNLTM
jgi:hypothetical protein